ncbi:flagellar basal body rod protein FlgB [Polynucleobacter paneuropaeus]|nr:flagellar basal body rod protein FlgB [Polynucleobacter paneuropaeus]
MTSLDQMLDFNATALAVRAKRQEVLAANIANADTPGFRARDIDFKSAMQKALEANGLDADAQNVSKMPKGADLLTTSPQHIKGDPLPQVAGEVDSSGLLYRSVVQDSADGNTVDPDVERSAFVSNSIHYEASVMLINASIKEMNTALQP